MDSKDRVPTPSIEPQSRKKAYLKPSVQVYGTLAEMTQTIDGNVGHGADGGTNVRGTKAHNRT
jgi:hypothetical protein